MNPGAGFEIRAPVVVRGRAPSISVTEVFHNTESLQVSGEETFVTLTPKHQSGVRTRDHRLSMQTALTATSGPPSAQEPGRLFSKHDTLIQR